MNITREFFANGNHAVIETTMCYPYNGAKNKILCYRTWIYDNENFLYGIICHETLTEAKNDLKINFGFWDI